MYPDSDVNQTDPAGSGDQKQSDMTTKNYNDVRRMMRKISAISADLEKMAFEQKTQIESAYLYDCSNLADELARRLEKLVTE